MKAFEGICWQTTNKLFPQANYLPSEDVPDLGDALRVRQTYSVWSCRVHRRPETGSRHC
jgi:hypothetical protein